MPISVAERKHQMPHGAQREVAEAEQVADSYITAVMNGTVVPKSEDAKERLRRIQVLLAAKLEPPLPVWEVFAEWDGERSVETPPEVVRA